MFPLQIVVIALEAFVPGVLGWKTEVSRREKTDKRYLGIYRLLLSLDVLIVQI